MWGTDPCVPGKWGQVSAWLVHRGGASPPGRPWERQTSPWEGVSAGKEPNKAEGLSNPISLLPSVPGQNVPGHFLVGFFVSGQMRGASFLGDLSWPVLQVSERQDLRGLPLPEADFVSPGYPLL